MESLLPARPSGVPLAGVRRDDSLGAVIRISSHRREIDTGYVVQYRTPDGRQVESLDSHLPSSLGPDSNHLALVIIPRAAVGGEITLKWATRDA